MVIRYGISTIGAGRRGRSLGRSLRAHGWRMHVLHTSRALSSDVLAPLRSFRVLAGSIHPLQSFSGVAMPALEGRIFAVQGDPGAIRAARIITRALGRQVFLLNPAAKRLSSHQAALGARPPEFFAAYQTLNSLAARVLARKPEGVLAALNEISHQATEKPRSKGASA